MIRAAELRKGDRVLFDDGHSAEVRLVGRGYVWLWKRSTGCRISSRSRTIGWVTTIASAVERDGIRHELKA